MITLLEAIMRCNVFHKERLLKLLKERIIMSTDDAQLLIDKIKESNKPTSSWEEDFIASIEDRIENGEKISNAQANKLQEIYRATQGG